MVDTRMLEKTMTIAAPLPRRYALLEEWRPRHRDRGHPFLEPKDHGANQRIDQSAQVGWVDGSATNVISFGPFRLLTTQRLQYRVDFGPACGRQPCCLCDGEGWSAPVDEKPCP